MKRIDKCGHIYYDSNDSLCPDCRKWRSYIESHPIRNRLKPESKTIQFILEKSHSSKVIEKNDKGLLNGCFETKDKNWVIRINLMNYSHLITEDLIIEAIMETCNHEVCHMVTWLINGQNDESFELSRKLDTSGLLKRLSEEKLI